MAAGKVRVDKWRITTFWCSSQLSLTTWLNESIRAGADSENCLRLVLCQFFKPSCCSIYERCHSNSSKVTCWNTLSTYIKHQRKHALNKQGLFCDFFLSIHCLFFTPFHSSMGSTVRLALSHLLESNSSSSCWDFSVWWFRFAGLQCLILLQHWYALGFWRPGASFINVAYAQKKASATLYAHRGIYKKENLAGKCAVLHANSDPCVRT